MHQYHFPIVFDHLSDVFRNLWTIMSIERLNQRGVSCKCWAALNIFWILYFLGHCFKKEAISIFLWCLSLETISSWLDNYLMRFIWIWCKNMLVHMSFLGRGSYRRRALGRSNLRLVILFNEIVFKELVCWLMTIEIMRVKKIANIDVNKIRMRLSAEIFLI